MAGTFSQLYVQAVFAVQGRANLIGSMWKDELHRYICGIIRNKGHKPIIVNGMPDHIHAFIGLRPAMAVADLVRDIKNNSANFINSRKFVKGRFSWQEGYGHSLIPGRKWRLYMTTSIHRPNITIRRVSRKSTSVCSKSLKLKPRRNIFLNGWTKTMSPLRG